MPVAARVLEASPGKPARLVALGCLALGIGVLVYLTDRDPSRAALIPAVAALSQSQLFGVVGLWLPSFVHPFAFSLFTAALQPPGRPPAYWACALWWGIDVGFELAQAPLLGAPLARGLGHSLWPAWLVDSLSNYAAHGTFDVADLIAATAGALAAAVVLRSTHGREAGNAL
jgi:hypothetical protein